MSFLWLLFSGGYKLYNILSKFGESINLKIVYFVCKEVMFQSFLKNAFISFLSYLLSIRKWKKKLISSKLQIPITPLIQIMLHRYSQFLITKRLIISRERICIVHAQVFNTDLSAYISPPFPLALLTLIIPKLCIKLF